ncbi:hypothetical protein AKJ29_18285 [Aliiroseovarius crassostreae]|uniref:Uncharacterized protein n=1 Tax=Aliiroseovarius crassostreae TaxID=154981 RepID=A0A0N8IC03_9RHOB|nr:hypothetical protein AKJ29_18285 [Aliiroseovarius crassostreae]
MSFLNTALVAPHKYIQLRQDVWGKAIVFHLLFNEPQEPVCGLFKIYGHLRVDVRVVGLEETLQHQTAT